MANNKERLTSNNERLGVVSDDIKTLPVIEDLNPELNTQEDIIEEIMKVLSSRGTIVPFGDHVWKRRKKTYRDITLPSGYTQVEYIESTGTQYINTGVAPTANTKIYLDAQLTSEASDITLFGTRNSNAGIFLLYRQNGKWCGAYDTSWFESKATSDGLERHVIEMSNEGVKIGENNAFSVSGSTFDTTYPIVLFGRNSTGTIDYKATLKVYEFQVEENGSLVLDCIPCINSSNVVGLYDLVSNTFKTNDGTGNFTAGPTDFEPLYRFDSEDYIVSSGPETYPVNGEQDGYLYTKFDPSALIANNIREGVDIFGILGTLIEGKAGVDFGEVTVSSETQNVTVNHSLGVVPSFVVMVSTTAYTSGYMWANINGIALRKYSSSPHSTKANTVTNTQITFAGYSSSYGWYGHHRWFAIV